MGLLWSGESTTSVNAEKSAPLVVKDNIVIEDESSQNVSIVSVVSSAPAPVLASTDAHTLVSVPVPKTETMPSSQLESEESNKSTAEVALAAPPLISICTPSGHLLQFDSIASAHKYLLHNFAWKYVQCSDNEMPTERAPRVHLELGKTYKVLN